MKGGGVQIPHPKTKLPSKSPALLELDNISNKFSLFLIKGSNFLLDRMYFNEHKGYQKISAFLSNA